MVEIGYTLSTEEHDAPTLVRNAPSAKEAGFDFVNVSDHFHPWVCTEQETFLGFAKDELLPALR